MTATPNPYETGQVSVGVFLLFGYMVGGGGGGGDVPLRGGGLGETAHPPTLLRLSPPPLRGFP